MAEITKVTTPIVPKENLASKFKPVTDQTFDITDPGKVHESAKGNKAAERQPDAGAGLKDSMGRSAVVPLLKNAGDMLQVIKRMALLAEMGVSASDITNDVQVRELLKNLFVSPGEFFGVLMEQDEASVLFKGEAFDILRDIMGKFEGFPKVKDAIANLLKVFEYNANSQNSIKTILYNCNNILDYMFTKDSSQFADYLRGLAEMLLPKGEAAKVIANLNLEQAQEEGEMPAQNTAQTPAQNTAQAQAQTQDKTQAAQNPNTPQAEKQADGAEQGKAGQANLPEQAAKAAAEMGKEHTEAVPVQAKSTEETAQAQRSAQGGQSAAQPETQQMSPKEAAQLLKSNLLPLLGEIVVKYHQNERIRDVVMVVVHNIVRVDKGTPEALNEAVDKLVKELGKVANLPENFEKNLMDAVKANLEHVKSTPNTVISKLSDIISETLSSPNANPAIARQAETMLISMLQNQGTMMDILHFVLPLETPQGQVFTELYVDPETEENAGKHQGKSRKIFLSVESEAHGSFELSFLETNEHVDFSIWCPEGLVHPLSGLKRHCADIMQLHGYTMNNFSISEMKEQHSVAEVFPRLLNKKVGIDVHI